MFSAFAGGQEQQIAGLVHDLAVPDAARNDYAVSGVAQLHHALGPVGVCDDDVDRSGEQGGNALTVRVQVPQGGVLGSVIRAQHPATKPSFAGEYLGPELWGDLERPIGTVVIKGYMFSAQVERANVAIVSRHNSTIAEIPCAVHPLLVMTNRCRRQSAVVRISAPTRYRLARGLINAAAIDVVDGCKGIASASSRNFDSGVLENPDGGSGLRTAAWHERADTDPKDRRTRGQRIFRRCLDVGAAEPQDRHLSDALDLADETGSVRRQHPILIDALEF